MAKTKGPLFSMSAQGSIADFLTFSTRNTGGQVRWQKKQKDVVTTARTKQRMFFSKAIEWWHMLTDEEKASFDGYTK